MMSHLDCTAMKSFIMLQLDYPTDYQQSEFRKELTMYEMPVTFKVWLHVICN